MANPLKADQDRLELSVYIILTSSRTSITDLEDIPICKQNRHCFVVFNVSNENVGCTALTMGHTSNFLQLRLKRKRKKTGSGLLFHKRLLSDFCIGRLSLYLIYQIPFLMRECCSTPLCHRCLALGIISAYLSFYLWGQSQTFNSPMCLSGLLNTGWPHVGVPPLQLGTESPCVAYAFAAAPKENSLEGNM